MNSFSGRPGIGKVDGNTTWADIVRGKVKRSRGLSSFSAALACCPFTDLTAISTGAGRTRRLGGEQSPMSERSPSANDEGDFAAESACFFY